MAAATGIRPAKLFSSLTWPWPSWCAGKLKAMLANKRPTWSPPLPPGPSPGSSTSTIGGGADAVLRYLARYVFRVAITNTRIVALDDHTVTIRYKKRNHRAGAAPHPGDEFVRRFLNTSAQRLAQGPLFWPLASFQTSARRSGTPPPGTRTHNSSGDRRPEPRHRHRTAALSLLRPRPPRLHPQAPAQKCPRTMTHFSRFQARLSLLCASLRRHSPLRPADPNIFPSPFNKRSNDLRCPATTLIKSVATTHSHFLGQTLIEPGRYQTEIPYPAEPPGASRQVRPSFCVGSAARNSNSF